MKSKLLTTLGLAGALALSGCGERKLVEPQRSNYQQGYSVVDSRGREWYPHRDSNGVIREIIAENGNTPKFVSDEDVKSGKAREPDGDFVYLITPEIRATIEAQQKLSAELSYQIDKSRYDTLKLKQSQTNEVKQEKSNYRAIIGSGSDGSIMVEKLSSTKSPLKGGSLAEDYNWLNQMVTQDRTNTVWGRTPLKFKRNPVWTTNSEAQQ